ASFYSLRKRRESGGRNSIKKWCQRRDLNPRPKAYESSALPLSYSGSREIIHGQNGACQIECRRIGSEGHLKMLRGFCTARLGACNKMSALTLTPTRTLTQFPEKSGVRVGVRV